MSEWMEISAFGWLRRRALDRPVAGYDEIGVAWESPCGVLIWLESGVRFFMRRTDTGFELGTEDYVRRHV